MSDTRVLTVHTDGAARGNPGPAAFAFVISRTGRPPVEEHGCLGEATNNVAEYTGIIKALEKAKELGGRRLVIHSDSELIVRQMQGIYKVKHDGLKLLHAEAKRLAADFDAVTFKHIPREQNRRADELCNEALDAAADLPLPRAKSNSQVSAGASSRPGKSAILPEGARHDILECLRTVAATWARDGPHHPTPDEVWDQIWTILEEAGLIKKAGR